MNYFRLPKESSTVNPVKAKKIRERLYDEFTTQEVKEVASIYCLKGSSVKAYISWLIKFRMIERVGVGKYRKVGEVSFAQGLIKCNHKLQNSLLIS